MAIADGGDRTGYQQDPANAREALARGRASTSAEGADMVMVKPALAYLDVIAGRAADGRRARWRRTTCRGEYAMVKAAAASRLDRRRAVVASSTSRRSSGPAPT